MYKYSHMLFIHSRFLCNTHSPSSTLPHSLNPFPYCAQIVTKTRIKILDELIFPPQPFTLKQRTPPSLSISTQNVGAMRGEFQKKHGPKFGIIRWLARRSLSFCVLTEVRCDPGNNKKSRIVKNMKPALYSVSQEPRGGVIVYSHPDYELLNHSVR